MAENLHAGSDGWRLGSSGYPIATDIGAEVKGYASATSVVGGQQITFYVSVRPVQPLKIDIYRLGWYNGSGGRLMVGGTWLPGITQDACPIDRVTALRVCDWRPTLRFTVPSNWVSGLYLAILTNADHFQNGIQFVVRDDASIAGLLYVQPVATYQAYNTWPSHAGGRSLYQGAKVSFDRPYSESGVGRYFFAFEQPFVAWLERAGYDVTYATSLDLDHQGAPLLLRHRVMVTAGHDEYWTAGMRAAATTARDRGVSLTFFSGNTMYWQARLEPASDGRSDRVLVCYRIAARDPIVIPALKTVRWRDEPVDQPEETLLGAQYTNLVAGHADWVVTAAGHWVYAGTGLVDGQLIRGLVSGESDRRVALPDSYAAPEVTQLSDSPFTTPSGGHDVSTAVIYQSSSGAWVFDAGTLGWPAKIDPFGRPDPRVERMTRNLLDVMLNTTPTR